MKNRIRESAASIVPVGERLYFQNDTIFFDGIVEEIRKIRTLKRPPKKSDFDSLKKYLMDEKGYNIDFVPCHGIQAWIYPPMLDKNHALYHVWRDAADEYKYIGKMLEDDSKKFLKENDVISGTIDSRTGKIGGDFSKIPVKIGIGNAFLDSNYGFTSEEVSSILSHELGHNYYYFEFLNRVTIDNYLLMMMSEGLLGMDTEAQKLTLIDKAKAKGYTVNKEALAKAKTKEEISLIIVGTAVEKCRSQLGKSVYDARNFEALADQYAIRIGGGKALASALQKLYKSFAGGPFDGFGTRFFFYALESVFHIATAGTILALFAMFGEEDHTYDTPTRRIEVIRQQFRQRLRQDIDVEEKKQILQALDDIEVLWEKAKDYDSILMAFWKIMPWNRGELKHTELQKAIENVASTRLSETAALLSTSV